MSEFLAKVSGQAEKARLTVWMRASIGEMDRILDGFPYIFGSNWRNKMRNSPTAARTKLLTYVLDNALDEMARRINIDYRPASIDDPAEAGFDSFLFGCGMENKLSLGKTPSSFATGTSHNTDNKDSRVLAVKVQSNDYKTTAVFAAIVDLSAATDGNTGWQSGFGLQIACADAGIVVPICGDINRGEKFVNVEYEPYRPGECESADLLQVL